MVVWSVLLCALRLEDRFVGFGWPEGVDMSNISECEARSLVGESIALYSLAGVLLPMVYGCGDPSVWTITPTSQRNTSRLVAASASTAPSDTLDKAKSCDRIRVMIKRRKVGGV